MRNARPEHPAVVRASHWLLVLTVATLIGTGLAIVEAPSLFRAAPGRDLFARPETAGASGLIWWHLAFGWLFVGVGLSYLAYQLKSGNYRQVLFSRGDLGGVWPMVRHYFFFGPKPPVPGTYNALQKLAYTTIIALGIFTGLTGLVLSVPKPFSPLVGWLGGFRVVRISHLVAMCGFLAFIPGHLTMVALHGWRNFLSMLTGATPDRRRVA